MACSKNIRIPATWLYPHQKVLKNHPKEDPDVPKELVTWLCNEVKLADEDMVNATFREIQPYLFVRLMYPQMPSDPFCLELYELNVYFLVAAYILDDYHMENYPTALIKKMVQAFNSLDHKMDGRFPDCPCGAELVKALSYFEDPSAIHILATMMDYINRSALIVWGSGRVPLNRARDFRRRMAGTLRAYLHAVQMKNIEWTELSVAHYLWWRCPESGAPCFYLSNEFYSGYLSETTASSIPLLTLYYHYLYGSAVCSVVNDLVSVYRDTNNDDVNIVKILDKSGGCTDAAAMVAIFKFLDSLMRSVYNSTVEIKAKYPECNSLIDFINDTTVGWIYIHTFTLRYSSSPDKALIIPLKEEMLDEWLNKEEDQSASKSLVKFQELLEKEIDQMKTLYAF